MDDQASYKQKLEVLKQQEELIQDEQEQEQREEDARRAKKEEEARLAQSLLPESEVCFVFVFNVPSPLTDGIPAPTREG